MAGSRSHGRHPTQPRYDTDQRRSTATNGDQESQRDQPDWAKAAEREAEDRAAQRKRDESDEQGRPGPKRDGREREDSKTAAQQPQPRDDRVESSDRTARALEAIFEEYKRQSAEERRQRPQEDARNENVARLALASTIVAGAVLVTSVWQSLSVQGQLNAAVTTNRAWIAIEPKMETPIAFNAKGGQFEISVTLKNVGHSPATDVRVAALGSALEFGVPRSAVTEITPACERARDDFLAPLALFPDETQTRTFEVRISEGVLERSVMPDTGPRGDTVIPLLYVCTTYRDAGNGGAQARTGLAYTIGLKGERIGSIKSVPIAPTNATASDFLIKRDFYGASIVE
ncbi:hypothetical protein HJG45_20095 [Roseicella sp. DB1501]|nr:hypothetical protein [Roseicella sp. DB1501]